MRIADNLVSDFKALGKNHLIGLGFAAAGFIVAYSVNKACLWFFAEKNKNGSQEDRNKEALKRLIFSVIALGVGLQTNMFLKCIASDLNIKHDPLNKSILVLHVASFAMASLMDQKKVCMGIMFSAAIAYMHPKTVSNGAAVVGSLLDYMREN
jgi:hypothetical protein